MAQPQRLELRNAVDGPMTVTAEQQLAGLQRLAELVGAMVLEVPRPRIKGQPTTYVSRQRLAELEQALINAGYDMPAVRQRYKQLRKEGRL